MMKELVSCAEFFQHLYYVVCCIVVLYCCIVLAFGDISYQKSADFWFGLRLQNASKDENPTDKKVKAINHTVTRMLVITFEAEDKLFQECKCVVKFLRNHFLWLY